MAEKKDTKPNRAGDRQPVNDKQQYQKIPAAGNDTQKNSGQSASAETTSSEYSNLPSGMRIIQRYERKFGEIKPSGQEGGAQSNPEEWSNNLTPRGQTDIPVGETKTGYVQKELGVSPERAQEYVDAIDAWTSNDYRKIRAYQQGESVEEQDKIAKMSEAIEEYIKKAPRWNGGETFRGIGLSDEELEQYVVGSVHGMRDTSSWSNVLKIAQQFAVSSRDRGNAVIFYSPTQNKGTAIRHIANSRVYRENEIVVSKESRYRVLKKKQDAKGIIHIYMEEV